jgi:hypothetical protein
VNDLKDDSLEPLEPRLAPRASWPHTYGREHRPTPRQPEDRFTGTWPPRSEYASDVRIRRVTAPGYPGSPADNLDGEQCTEDDEHADVVQLSGDLGRDGVTLLLARDIGQVRDLLRRAGAEDTLAHVYPTVDAAVDAAHGHSSDQTTG